MAFGEAAQADFIQVRQRRDHLERLAGRYVEIIRGFVADNDVDLHPTRQGPVDFAGHRQRQVEVRRTNGQLMLGTGDQLEDHPVQRVVLADPEQWAHRQMAIGQQPRGGVIGGVLQTAAQVADVVAQAAGGRQVGQVQAVHGLRRDQPVLHQVLHRVSQRRVVDQVIAVKTVLVELVQVHVVQAGTAVQHRVIDHKALEVQHAEQFAGLHRHAVNRHVAGVGLGHGLVPGAVARLLAGTNQPALGTQRIHHHHNVQLGPRSLGGVQRVVDLLACFVLLQIQRNDVDTPCGLGDFFQQATAKRISAGQHLDGIGSQWETAQLGQQGAFEERRHKARNGRIRRGPELTPWGCSGLAVAARKNSIDQGERSFYCCRHE